MQSTCLFDHPVPRRNMLMEKKIKDNISINVRMHVPPDCNFAKFASWKTIFQICVASSSMYKKNSIARFFFHTKQFTNALTFIIITSKTGNNYIRIDMKWSWFLMMSTG